jgi:hypothetical protein
MKLPAHRHILGSATFFVLCSLLLAARPAGLALQDPGNQVSGQEPKLTPLDRDFSEEDLVAMGTEAFAAVKEGYETELESVTFRFGTSEEIAGILVAENLKAIARQLEEGAEQKEIEKTAKAAVQTLASATIAKYCFGANEILVNLDVLFIIEESGLVGMASREALQATLVHEVMHAVHDAQFPIDHLMEGIVDMDSAQAINALIEGHAQFHARRICEAQGWQAGFERFSSAIGWLPPTEDAARALLMKVAIAQMRFWYETGEQFFVAVHAALGDEGVRLVFENPPMESILISEPGWYLQPETRPVAEFDLEERLDSVVAWYGERDVNLMKMKMLEPQILAALSLLPEADVKLAVGEIHDNMLGFAQGRKSFLSAGLFAMSSAVWSKSFYSLEEQLLHIKDETLKEGNVKILEANYTPFEAGDKFGASTVRGYRGLYALKRMQAGSQKMEVSTLVAISGRTVVEVTGMDNLEAVLIEEMIHVANMLLDPEPPTAGGDEADVQSNGSGGDIPAVVERFTRATVTLSGGKTMAHYSFTDAGWVEDWEESEMTLFYDADDCARGAVIGYDDRKGIHILGKRTPLELKNVGPLGYRFRWSHGIRPLNKKTAQGTAFFVKRQSKGLVLVHLVSVTESSYEELKKGATASFTFSWKLVE